MTNRSFRRRCASAVVAAAVILSLTASAARTGHREEASMTQKPRILVHVTHGPEHPTRAALGFLVAKTAIDEGHPVSLFLAGDAVQLLRDPVLDTLAGLGTGRLRELYDSLAAAGARFYLSGMSSNARGVTAADLKGKPAEMATPAVLLRLALEHDRMFTY
jgi:predicted peroxiredoxin